jgi:hypothetical protein
MVKLFALQFNNMNSCGPVQNNFQKVCNIPSSKAAYERPTYNIVK